MSKPILPKENIKLNAVISTKEEAIREAGHVLVKGGYVANAYVEKMFEREELTSTFIGNYIAIPHGTEDAKDTVLASGISILQLANPIDYGHGNEVKMIFGIAGKNNEHLDILSKIAIVCSDEANINKMVNASSEEELLSLFSEVN
ncbi:PTS sugar transporter subunit IIA [Salipaludibacillus sp. LMS25]|uniref:PTS sugar transporter subunit IIA n=1 Tax=Salipaludibacillus sp. LMS25 TaxID=2924031 RepID=UPI0020D18877|nr:PTS sugar transporter subunit IIA [Salipaludibacillus sp. LMS25]UTR16825.1 PTS sugar transporter subunit IIA [Salipaludibacillus sp. LMS25]